MALRMPFDSSEAKGLNIQIFGTIYHGALEASCEIATLNWAKHLKLPCLIFTLASVCNSTSLKVQTLKPLVNVISYIFVQGTALSTDAILTSPCKISAVELNDPALAH
jgi:hypothetical protein